MSENGGERERIAGLAYRLPMLPDGVQFNCQLGSVSLIEMYGVDTFAGTLLKSDGSIMKISDQFEPTKVRGGSLYLTEYPYVASRDGASLLFLDSSGNLLAADLRQEEPEGVVLAKHVRNFAASKDGKLIYYINVDAELWCIKDGGEPSPFLGFRALRQGSQPLGRTRHGKVHRNAWYLITKGRVEHGIF